MSPVSAVCGERYLGPVDWPHQLRAWTLEDCGRDIGSLITVVMEADTEEQVMGPGFKIKMMNCLQVERVTRSLWLSYPGVPVIVETGLAGLGARAGVRVVSSGQDLGSLASLVTTEYVLLASDLDYVSNWTNIERGVSRAKEITVSMSSNGL